MKIRSLTLGFAIGVITCALHAQQSTPVMPDMKMPPQSDAPATPTSGRKQSEVPIADDMKRQQKDLGDAKAKAAAASVEQSFQQQSQKAHGIPAADSDAGSMKVPIQELQEPEAIGFQTGSDLPAPELLGEVMTREPMSVESFIAMADKSNPTLAQAHRDAERSEQQARQVGLPPDPIAGYSGDHIRGGSYHAGEEGAFFSQEFLLGRKLALRRDVYRAEGRSNQLAVEVQRARIQNDVARAFFDALTVQQTIVIDERLLKVALDNVTNTHELERSGQADSTDVLNSEIASEQAKIDFVSAQRMFLSSFTQLSTLAGQADLAPSPLAGSLVEPPDLDIATVVATDIQESPAVKQAEANVSSAEAELKSSQREKIPNLNVKAGEWYSGEDLGSSRQKAGWESFVEVGVQIPLWNRNQGNIGAAKVELERAHENVTRTQLMTKNRAEPYAQEYQIARYTADKYRKEMLPRARRAYELEVTKYQQMGQAYPHVLAAQRMLFTLQLAYVQALKEEWHAAIALQNYTLTSALDEPMSVGERSTSMNTPTALGGGG